MGKQLEGKLLERAAAPVQGDTCERTLMINHTLNQNSSVSMTGLHFKTKSSTSRVALKVR